MLGKPVPDFSLPSTGRSSSDVSFQLSSQRARKLSRDSLASHQRFKEKTKFPFELLADPDAAVGKRFGVMKMKNMYGKQVRGIPKGLRGVQVTGHVQEVLNFVKSL
jgi:peroxiredoxin Q/BCP